MLQNAKPFSIFFFLVFLLFSTPAFSQAPDSLNLCSDGSVLTSSAANGVFYDSGGPFNYYYDSEFCTLLIDPGCAESITITVHEYSTENCCDALRFYDGPDQSSPLLLDMQYLGAPQTATFSSGKVFVLWGSDGSVTRDGFRVTWSSDLIAPTPPVIDVFSASDINPALQESVQFSASATNYPQQWQWDFGDGSSSNQQNPSHTFSTPGQDTVRLIVINCFGLADTAEQVLKVQEAPTVIAEPDTLDVTVDCGSTTETALNLINTGQGDLTFKLSRSSSNTKVRPLIYTYNAFFYSVGGIQSELAAYSSQYDLLFSAETDPAAFAAQLAETDVLIFPDMPPSVETQTVLYGLRDAILDFVAKGGSIVFCGQEYGGDVLPFTGLWESDFSPYYFGGSYIELPTQHPITAGLPSGIYTQYASMAINFTNPDYVSLGNIDVFSWLGFREVGDAKVIYLGSNFNGHDALLGQLLHNSLQWCGSRGNFIASPSEGTVAPGDTLQLNLQFSGENLYAGDYPGTITLETNDPAQPLLEIPYTLHVLGTPSLEASPNALDFASLQQFSQSGQQVAVSNSGCDTLFVQNIAPTSAGYTVEPQQLTVLPFSTEYVNVIFAPQDTGQHTGHLVLQSNVGTDSISYTGYSVGAPIMGVSPQSLSATVACGDSVTLPLTITNTGLGNLEIQVTGAAGSAGQAPLKILVMYTGAASGYIVDRTEQAILARTPNAQLTRFDVQDISQLPSLLADKNLVVAPFLGFGDLSYYAQLGQAIRPFVESGGGLIFTGTNAWQSLNAYGFLQCTGDVINAYGYGMEAIVPQHPILQGMNLAEGVYDDFMGQIFTSASFEPLAKIGFYPHTAIGVQPFGSGKVVYLAPAFSYHTDNMLDLMENAVKWCARPSWLSVSSTSVTVPAGGSTTIQVQFNAAGLAENTFSSNLVFSTNDPQNPQLSIPCTMVVEGEPQLAGLPANLNFGIMQQFAQKDLAIEFENMGCDTLNVWSATIDNPIFQVLNFDATSLPNSKGDLRVRFAPLLPGNQSATLTIVTDAGTFSIALSGIAVGAPIGAIAPGSLSMDLACDESATLSVALSNAGLGGLNYQVGNLQSPRKALAITYGANISYWNNVRGLMLQEVPNLSLSEYSGSTAAQLADSIGQNRVDVLIVPTLDFSANLVYASFAPAIQGFLQNGGQVLVLGAYNADPLDQMGLFELIGTEYYDFPLVRVSDKSHRLTEDIFDTYQVAETCYLGVFPFGDVRPVILGPNDNQIFLGYRNVGQGNVVYWAQTFNNPSSLSAKLMKNVFAWFSNPVPSGVEVPAVGGIVPIGGNTQVPVVFSGENLPGGQYTGQIRFYTNDPVNNPLIVPITLNMRFEPCTDFDFTVPPCSGVVSFKDNTLNSATSWYWDFGDGGTSFAKNPTHTYASENVYNVALVSCNNFGCDTLLRPIGILSIDGPRLANCDPQTTSDCCGAGIRRVQLGLLNHFSADALTEEGYKDFSCSKGTELMAGIQFPLTITTGNQNEEYVRGWIDLNDNGVFSDNEQIINDQAFQTHHTFFTPPINAVKDVPLRMRIMSEPTFVGQIASPCSNLAYGQCEDYYVIVRTTVGTSEPGEAMDVRVYPNPSAGEAWLEFNLPEARAVALKIADLMGRIVWENKLEDVVAGSNRLQLPELPAGAYAISVQSGATIKVEKFVRVERP